MNMSNTRWLYVAHRQWRRLQYKLAALREITPREERKNIGENLWEAWGKGAKEKWGGEESLKKKREKSKKNVPLKESNEADDDDDG
jgi:hypothetical protein